MKKTLTVNLGGTVFNIDEDAYQLLDKYLSNLRLHFLHEEGTDEIMEDFETRISELFAERVRLGHEVITIEHVETIIERMGKPEELFGEADDSFQEKTNSIPEDRQPAGTYRKKLMRDPDDRIFGGVASGFAAYMDWDATIIRLILIVLLFLPVNIPIGLIYIILWIAIPKASTAADKLMMRGENVTIENIGKTVTDKFDNPSVAATESEPTTDKPRTSLQKAADIFVTIIGFLLKGLLILAAVIAIPALLVALPFLLLALLAGFSGITAISNLLPGTINGLSAVPFFSGGISLLLIIGIPVCVLLYQLCVSLFKFSPIPKAARWVLLILWIAAIIGSVWSFFQMGTHTYGLWDHMWHPFHWGIP